VTDEVYRKYENIISVDQMLFNYGIIVNKEVQKVLAKIKKYDDIVSQVDTEYKLNDTASEIKSQSTN